MYNDLIQLILIYLIGIFIANNHVAATSIHNPLPQKYLWVLSIMCILWPILLVYILICNVVDS